MKIIKVTSRFDKNYKRLPKEIKVKAKEKEKLFRNNIFDKRLRTHKLKGDKRDVWVFWIKYDYRIKFVFISDNEVLFLSIGTHGIYR